MLFFFGLLFATDEHIPFHIAAAAAAAVMTTGTRAGLTGHAIYFYYPNLSYVDRLWFVAILEHVMLVIKVCLAHARARAPHKTGRGRAEGVLDRIREERSTALTLQVLQAMLCACAAMVQAVCVCVCVRARGACTALWEPVDRMAAQARESCARGRRQGVCGRGGVHHA